MRSPRISSFSVLATLAANLIAPSGVLAKQVNAIALPPSPSKNPAPQAAAQKDADAARSATRQTARGSATARIVRPIRVEWREGEIRSEPKFLHITVNEIDGIPIVTFE